MKKKTRYQAKATQAEYTQEQAQLKQPSSIQQPGGEKKSYIRQTLLALQATRCTCNKCSVEGQYWCCIGRTKERGQEAAAGMRLRS